MNFGNLKLLSTGIDFSTPLGPVAWAVLAGVPVGIIALYFLKLRRKPVKVPSTLLWRRSMEDLHVNSLFQRLRRNLLLFLQLLTVLLAMLALAGPRIKGSTGQGQRYILAIDNSASMAATDVAPTRLAKAKIEAKKIVDAMENDDLAMVIAFADRARVVASYTGHRGLLRQKIDAIEPTQGTTSLRDALQVAAGLANPSKQIGEGVVASSVVTPKLKIFTDGGFPDVEGFSLGNLEPEVIVIGPPPPPITGIPDPTQTEVRSEPPSDNVALLALGTRSKEEKASEYQVFGRVHNFRAEPVTTEAKLLKHAADQPRGEGTLIDAIALTIPARGEKAFEFDLPDPGTIDLEVRIDVADALAVDNRAFTVIGAPRKAQVLVITPGNRYLTDTLNTETTQQAADVTIIGPEEAKSDPITRALRAGQFDLVIYDRFRPDANPEANTLYFGVLPPGKAFEQTKPLDSPIILDINTTHPLMQYITDLPTVIVAKALGVELPNGAVPLIESNQGPLAFVVPREGYSDAVVTFALYEGTNLNSTWYSHASYPLFLLNAIRVLGNTRESAGEEIHQPGQPVVIRAELGAETVDVTGPDGRSERLSRSPQDTFVYNHAATTGIYHARWGKDGLLAFAVNLFDIRESNLAPRGLVPEGVPATQADAYKIKIGYNPVAATQKPARSYKDWWQWIALAALGVILLEWYIYNRRVYI
jgi:hypothetical protein